jgi:hypothetical protein
MMDSGQYRVIYVYAFTKDAKKDTNHSFYKRLAVPKDSPDWMVDLACFGTAYRDGGLNNKEYTIMKSEYNEGLKKYVNTYLDGPSIGGCNCGSSK